MTLTPEDVFVKPDDVFIETACSFCNAKLTGIVYKWGTYPQGLFKDLVGYQCANCSTVVCRKCSGKKLKSSFWSGFEKTICPTCCQHFGPGVGILGLTMEEFNYEREASSEVINQANSEREEKIARAKQGVFNCGVRASDRVLDGAQCFVCNNYMTDVNMNDVGLVLGQLPFFRNEKSRTIAALSQGHLILNALGTAAAMHYLSLSIPWSDIKKCRLESIVDENVACIVVFTNQAECRQEWVGLEFPQQPEQELRDIFLDHLKKHGVKVMQNRKVHKREE